MDNSEGDPSPRALEMSRLSLAFVTIYLATLTQAVPEDAVVDEVLTDVIIVDSIKRESNIRHYKLKAFNEEINLHLVKTEGLLPKNLPVYVFGRSADGKESVDDWTHNTESRQGLYIDTATGNSIMVDETDSETKLTGMLKDDLIIEPVEDISLPEGQQKREVKHIRHMVYRVKKQKEETTVYDFVAEEVYNTSSYQQEGNEKRQLPERVYVSVHVVVDFKLFKKLNKPEADVIKYVKIFYNGVNSVYSTISWPSVSISIAGITICKDATACAMVEKSRLGTDGVNAKTALSDITAYAYNQRSVIGTDYALIMVMTDYDLCSPSATGTCERSTAGLAYVGTVCDSYQFTKTSKAGISEDHGAFDGIKTVSHEIGHLLGMAHDGQGPHAQGAPGALKCRWDDNYIMGQVSFVSNQFKWSECSVAQLRWLAVQPKASCLLKKPSSTPFQLVSIFPGKELSLDNQCKILYGPTSGVGCKEPGINSGNDALCLSLMCKTAADRCSSSSSAAEGSYCGPQRHCIMGKCVCDPSAPTPTPPTKDPACKGDNTRILINGKDCVSLLSSADGMSNCNSELVLRYCCESRVKYCRATPITCDGKDLPSTEKPTSPRFVFTPSATTTEKPYEPPKSANCGKPCADTPNMLINGQTCARLLATNDLKSRMCDNPTVIQHCCSTRVLVCKGFHWITESCDPTCQDNAMMSINGERCVPFLSTATKRENFCESDVTKQHCCATRRKVCLNGDIMG